MQPLAAIPSPSESVWHLGPFPLRAYAVMIIIGIVLGVWLGERRWAAKGGQPGTVVDVAVWAVPFGLVGGRLYHVITDWQRYFGADGDPAMALQVWQGGLGIWGAVALGGVGAWIACRRRNISVLAFGDAIAPGIALGQAVGRWGNWWNQELYGSPLSSFPGLEIDPANRPKLSDGSLDPRYADIATYHPTFLYESLWCAALAVVVIWAGRRFSLTHGRTFALYVAGYTAGRFWIEALRIDEAHDVLGMRLNQWTSLLVFAGAVAFVYLRRDDTSPERVGAAPPDTSDAALPPQPGEAGDTRVDLAKDRTGTEPTVEDSEPAKDADEPAPEKDADEAEPVPDEEPEPAKDTDEPEPAPEESEPAKDTEAEPATEDGPARVKDVDEAEPAPEESEPVEAKDADGEPAPERGSSR